MDYSRVRGTPFILCSNVAAIDARKFGSKARFIRRSCTPNAEVREVSCLKRFPLSCLLINYFSPIRLQRIIDYSYTFIQNRKFLPTPKFPFPLIIPGKLAFTEPNVPVIKPHVLRKSRKKKKKHNSFFFFPS